MSHSQFPRFVLAGGFAALANMGSRILFSRFVPYVPAIILAYLVGMLTAFVLNRRFVFPGATRPIHGQAFWFTLVNLGAVAQTVAISLLLSHWFMPRIGWTYAPETLAHVIGVVVPVFTSYFGHRHLTFAGHDRSTR
ncbi:MAG TPA: GtrA family protein [Xanthomonadaceae bacterium]|jgi:putative flippase GtrA|nr:GtrA family protein [Xanthomonadaceae bacterium]